MTFCLRLFKIFFRCLCKPPFSGNYPTTGKYDFPQLAKVNYLPEEPALPFNYLKSTKDRENYWFRCFTADERFHRLYNHFEEYVPLLRQAKGLISADFSLFRDYPEQILIDNCRANRLVDYALQQAGIPMIPTAGFADESSWEWCFDGLPLNSTVAITTNCLGRDREAHRLFVGGVNAMIAKVHPTAIVVCGKCPAWLAKKYPDIQIIHIPSYSEIWHEREKRKLIGRRKPTGRIILKGGYGGTSERDPKKDGCYYDSEDGKNKRKIKDKNAIEVAEYYLSEGKYVVFYHEDGINKVPDLSVDFKMVVEVKGVSSLNSTRIKENIEKASLQIEAKLSKYPEGDRHEGKIVLLSRYTQSFEVGYNIVYEGYRRAKEEGLVRFQVEFWFHGEIHVLEEEE